MPTDKTPTLLTTAQRTQFVRIPDDLTDREMAGACPFTYRRMSWASDWHLREETLLRALELLRDEAVIALAEVPEE